MTDADRAAFKRRHLPLLKIALEECRERLTMRRYEEHVVLGHIRALEKEIAEIEASASHDIAKEPRR